MMIRRHVLLWWNFRARRELQICANRTSQIRKDSILGFLTLRNEISRLPHFFDHHRKLGVDHFLVVDNDSTDGSREWLEAQPDVSIWTTKFSYKASRFGMNWLGWLQMLYGHGHWCLTLDADEIFVYPNHGQANLRALTRWLSNQRISCMSAMMLDLYPKGPLSTAVMSEGETPLDALGWFDATGYTFDFQPRYNHTSVRGGPRKRVFFASEPELAPHLHKTPLVFWKRHYTYASSTHLALPTRLNNGYFEGNPAPTGLLLHTKFLSEVISKSAEEKQRREHFIRAENYLNYYDGVIADPVLWYEGSVSLEDDTDFVALGLMRRGQWRA
ncbi:MAG: glycosyltransferase family 2 protein [Verrucomicrobiota bacterium]